MNELYEILITSILGVKGQKVWLPHSTQTQQRINKGIVKLAEQHKPTELKVKPKKSKS